mmetsp:Transcript_14095/g.28265  ORF Transcript_14095/g.28265 Transcript_14095/m.28265 type:complete len:125 (-) Transcript_14095:507-881(-)
MHIFDHPFTHAFIHSLTHSSVQSCTHAYTHSRVPAKISQLQNAFIDSLERPKSEHGEDDARRNVREVVWNEGRTRRHRQKKKTRQADGGFQALPPVLKEIFTLTEREETYTRTFHSPPVYAQTH